VTTTLVHCLPPSTTAQRPPGPRGELDTSPDAQRRLILVNEAFRVLADPAERQKYDRRTATCVRRPPPPPPGGIREETSTLATAASPCVE